MFIDGFGIFHKFHVKKLSSGLTIFVGSNEAGKSTLLNFQKRILFGFPDKRGNVNLYPPQNGGKHGGRIIVEANKNQKIIIERYADSSKKIKIVFPDGKEGGISDLSALMGHADEDIYANIYAFGLSELQKFKTLNNEAVKSRLYSAGTGIGTVSLAKIQNNMEKEAGELFKPRGKKLINDLYAKIKEINTRLKEIGDEITKYDNLHKELESITADITNLGQEKSIINRDNSYIENLLRIWEDWNCLNDAQSRISSIPEVQSFPENGIVMLEKYLDKSEELEEEITAHKREIKDIEIRKSNIAIDKTLIENKDSISELQKGQEKYISIQNEIPALEEQLKQETDAFNALLKDIGRDWNENKLLSFDCSIPVKDIVRKRNNDLKSISEQVSTNSNELFSIEQQIEDTNNKIRNIDERIKKQQLVNSDKDTIRNQKRAIGILRASFLDLKDKESDIKDMQHSEELFAAMQLKTKDDSFKIPVLPAVVMGIAGLASLVWAIIAKNASLGIGVFAILGAASIVFFILSSEKMKKSDVAIDNNLNKKNIEFSQKREKIENELNVLKVAMLDNAKLCGFDSIPNSQLIENKAQDLQTIHERILQLNEVVRQKEDLQQELKYYIDKSDKLRIQKDNLQKKEVEKNHAWGKWLIENGFNTNMTPDSIIELFTAIKTGIDKKKSIDNISLQLEKNQKYQKSYKDKVEAILKNRKRKKSNINVTAEVEKLINDLESNLENSRKMNQLTQKDEEIKLALKSKTIRHDELKQKIKELFTKGYAKDEAEFRQNGRDWADRVNLNKEIINYEKSIKRVSGMDKYEEYKRELERTQRDILEEKKSKLEERLVILEDKLTDLNKKSGGIVTEIKQIECRDESSILRMNKAGQIQEIEKYSEEWSVLVLAKYLLRKAIEKYEKERQPDVFKEAQTFFSSMTLGKYKRIYAPLGQNKVYVIDDKGKQKDLFELSTATAEQLYLSIRFGFIREFGKRSESLPIIFDDILVNFDPDRITAACEAIKNLINTNQVLYYTCHPDTADLLIKKIPSAKMIKL